MKKKKQQRTKKTTRRFITAGLFIIFSAVLFINNITQLFDKFDLHYEINLIVWVGLIGSVIYIIYKLAGKNL